METEPMYELGPSEAAGVGELLPLAKLLESCVIRGTYSVPDSLATPIALSERGHALARKILDRRKVKPNELKMAVFLESFDSDGLLFDVENCNPAALREALSKEILLNRIRYPYIFGRELHDAAAKLFPERTQLNSKQTLQLLDELPRGVFQDGITVVGPLGALRSASFRTMSANLTVPGYLCSDDTCSNIHTIELQTGDSGVSRARRLVQDEVERTSAGGDYGFLDPVRDHLYSLTSRTTPLASDSMTNLIADSFSNGEMRTVVENGVNRRFSRDGGRRVFAELLGQDLTSAQALVESLDRPSLLQVLMLLSDEEISKSLDEVVRRGDILLEEYEVRMPRLSRGQDAVRAELGPWGVRSARRNAVADRIVQLLSNIYFSGGRAEPADLAFVLSMQGVEDENLLIKCVQNRLPAEIVDGAILSDRHATASAAEHLHIEEPFELGRDELRQTILWKLGAPREVMFNELEQMRILESDLEKASSGAADQASIRGSISNLFTTIEDALQRSLAFSAWAFCSDHFLNQDGFEYNPRVDPGTLGMIDDILPPSDNRLRFRLDGRNTLAPLSAGFARLAKLLDCQERVRRPLLQHPQMCRSGVRPFAFEFERMFDCLSGESQNEVVASLKMVTALFNDEAVLRVRNATQHGNNEFPTIQQVKRAVELVAEGRLLLERVGFFPQVYSLVAERGDGFGRRQIEYERHGRPIVLFSPSWTVAPGLPATVPRLIIVPSAVVEANGPLRFTIRGRTGDESYWDGWPKRWRVDRGKGSSNPQSDGRVGPRPTPEFDLQTG